MDRSLVSSRAIRYLVAVAEFRNFTRAAEMLYVSQPSLSQQIKLLEDVLDVQLIDRSGRSVRLTDAGEIYVRYARRAIVELDAGKRAIHQLQDLSRGSLKLGVTPITEFLSAPLLEAFSSRYPGVAISTLEMSQSDIEAAVAEDRIDLGIAFTNALSTEARSSDIQTQILFIETLHLSVGKTHPLAGRDSPLSGHVLEQIPLVFLNSKFALRRLVDLYCLEHNITPCIAVETNSLSVIMEMVRLGRVATVLPQAIACAHGWLHPLMLLPELPNHTITLICRKGAYKSPACLAFGDLASEWSARRCEAASRERLRPCPLVETCEKAAEVAALTSRP
jgi:LysR family transcriptional regulator, cyn operon transcriptional activator